MDPYGSERHWYWVGRVVPALGAFGMIRRSHGKPRYAERERAHEKRELAGMVTRR